MPADRIPLTRDLIGAMLVVGAENSTVADGRPEDAAIFVPGFSPEHTPSEGGVRRNKALRGTNKPACPQQVFGSLHQGRPEKSLPVGRLNASVEGFDMAANTGSASALSISDLNTTINHEPRVSHVRLSAVLGYDSPHRLADLIERNAAELERYGEVSRTVRETTSKGGRPGRDYWLNEAQALLACIRSDAPNAPDVRQQVIEVYMAYRRGELPAPANDKPMTLADMDRARRLVAECRKVNGPRAAQAMWRELGLPGGEPDQPSLPQIVGPALRPGIGVMVINDAYVIFDATSTDVRDGDECLVVRHYHSRPQVPQVARVRVFPNHDAPALEGVAHLPREPWLGGGTISPACRILGRIIDVKEAPHV